MRASRLIAIAAACSLSAACATFQASPSASTCAQSQQEYADAQIAFTVASVAVNTAQAQGAKPSTIAKYQADLAAAQQLLNSLEAVVASKCGVRATPSSPPAATPVP